MRGPAPSSGGGARARAEGAKKRCKVSYDDLSVPNSLGSVLGFSKTCIYGFGRNGNENPVNIMSVNSIPVRYSFFVYVW